MVGNSSRHHSIVVDQSLLITHACWRAKYGQSISRKISKKAVGIALIVSQPRAYCCHQLLVKILVFLVGAMFIFTAGLGADALQRDVFTIQNLNSITLTVETAQFDIDYVLLQNYGCGSYQLLKVLNKNLSWNFGSPINVDGLDLAFGSNASCFNKRFYFSLQGYQTTEIPQFIGFPSMRWTSTGIRFINHSIERCPPHISFVFHPPWPWYFSGESIPYNICLGVGFIIAGFGALWERVDESTRLFVLFIHLVSLSLLVSFLGFLSHGMLRESFLPFWEFLAWTSLAASLSYASHAIIEVLLGISIFIFAGRMINDLALFQDPMYLLKQPGQPVACASFFLTGCLFWFRRRRLQCSAIAGMAEYTDMFDQCWIQLLASEGPALEQLQLYAATTPGIYGRARQCCRKLESNAQESAKLASRSVRHDSEELVLPSSANSFSRIRFEEPATIPATAGAPVASLDQLYSQAMFLAPVLAAACAEWAATSGGTVYRRGGALAADSNDSDGLPKRLRAWVLAGFVKFPERAARKAAACYDGDPSRVLDVCRGRIFFEAVEDLVRCVRLINAQSPAVAVLRLHCGLSPKYNAERSAGFRAVILSVTFDTDATRQLGLEGHVCEVQLVHQTYAKALDTLNSDRYHAFRESRVARADEGGVGERFSRSPRGCAIWSQVMPGGAEGPGENLTRGGRQIDAEAQTPEHIERVVSAAVTCGPSHSSGSGLLPFLANNGINDSDIVSDLCVVANRVYQRYALGFCGELDRHVWNFEAAMHMASSSSVLFSIRPINAFATTRMGLVFYIVLVVLLVALIAVAWWLESEVQLGNAGDVYRIKVWKAGSVMEASVQGPEAFFVDECLLASLSSKTENVYHPEGNKSSFRGLNGYSLRLSTGSQDSDSVSSNHSLSWVLERSRPGGNSTSWNPVGLCSWVSVWIQGSSGIWTECAWTTVDCVSGRLNAKAPIGLIRISFKPDKSFFWLSFGNYWIPAGFMCVVLAVTCKCAGAVKHIIMLATGGFGAWSLFWGLYAIISGQGWRRAVFLWSAFYSLPMMWVPVGFAFISEKRFVLIALVTGLLLEADVAILVFLTYQGQFVLNARTFINIVTGLYLISIAVLWFMLSQRQLKYAKRLVLDDILCYDRIWNRILENEGFDCINLKQQVNVIACKAANMLQMSPSQRRVRVFADNFHCSSSIVMKTLYHVLPWSKFKQNKSRPFTQEECMQHICQGSNCLDHLFVQALCLEPLLVNKLRLWSGSKGLAQQHGPRGCVTFKPFAEVPGLVYCDQNSHSHLKSAHRAIEKVIRSYNHNVSRLTDVCRQTAVFPDVASLTQCMVAIDSDPEVELVRIKNRMDQHYDSRHSAGYRDVNINLRITSPAAIHLGVNTHICEVQLVLLPVAQLKSKGGHSNYIICRNLRAD